MLARRMTMKMVTTWQNPVTKMVEIYNDVRYNEYVIMNNNKPGIISSHVTDKQEEEEEEEGGV